MTTLSKKWSGADPPQAHKRSCNCVFCGGVAGLMIALAVFFGGSTYFASVNGLCAASCFTLGTYMTILLSQPVALAGVLMGAACGGAYACTTSQRKKGQGPN